MSEFFESIGVKFLVVAGFAYFAVVIVIIQQSRRKRGEK